MREGRNHPQIKPQGEKKIALQKLASQAQKTPRRATATAAAAALVLEVHLERHLAGLGDGRLLAARVARHLALRRLLVEELASLAHREGDELALALALRLVPAPVAAGEHLEGLHGGGVSDRVVVGLFAVVGVAKVLFVVPNSSFCFGGGGVEKMC